MGKQHEASPRVTVEQASISPGPAPGRWLTCWRIRNLGQESLELLTARLPHSRFRSEDKELALRPKLSPGESTLVELPVLCREPPGSVVDNAFLILHLIWRGERWLVFTRLQVAIDTEGRPQATTQTVTAQPAALGA